MTGVAIFMGACAPAPDSNDTFSEALSVMEQEIGGSIGAYALDTASGKWQGHRADERFAMASTFKPLLAAAVLAEVDAGRLSLDDKFSTDGVTMQPYSPVVGELGPGETIDLVALCAASVSISDNTATNLLLDRVGGPAGLTNFLRANGDATTRLDRYEVELNTNLPGDERDTTTPRAMSHTFERLLLSDTLSEPSRTLLQSWLLASTTGLRRLRAGIPSEWRVGDKTGYGMNGAVNDVAIAWPPGRPPIIIAVYMSGTDKDVATLNAVHANIAALAIKLLQE
ncbi:MAG: class A beta-lactamase [Woeseia sp.]